MHSLLFVDYTRIEDELLEVDGYKIPFFFAGEGTKVSMHFIGTLFVLMVYQLGDYGYFSDSEQFCSQGNLFSDFKSCIPEADIIPRKHKVETLGHGKVVDGMGLSLPSNPTFNSLLASLSPKLPNAYLVTHVVRHRPGESATCIIFVFKI